MTTMTLPKSVETFGANDENDFEATFGERTNRIVAKHFVSEGFSQRVSSTDLPGNSRDWLACRGRRGLDREAGGSKQGEQWLTWRTNALFDEPAAAPEDKGEPPGLRGHASVETDNSTERP